MTPNTEDPAAPAPASAAGAGRAASSDSSGGIAARPNVVVILTDDQGYADLSCAGSPDLRTPHLDGLAARGVRFRSFYAGSAVCSPSRAALLTGRFPGNAGVRSILAGHRTATGLSPRVPTIASALSGLGYRTTMVGKWHLGVREDCRPDRHGFQSWYGFLAGCVDYYSHIFYWGSTDPLHDLWDNGREVFQNGRYLTELITERAVAEIGAACRSGEPFFAYVAYNAPHYPLHAPRAYLDRFPDLPPARRVMAAMVAAVDDGVGSILAELDRQGVRDDTIVVFCSDNGPSRETRNWLDGSREPYPGGSTGALTGQKFSLFDGGIRVPGILSWPARIPGGQVRDEPVGAVDVLPTILSAAGGAADLGEVDGVDLLPLLSGAVDLPDRQLCWELGPQTAVREGRWKLVLDGQLAEGVPAEDDVVLVDLVADPGERRNLRHDRPELAARLAAAARAWRAGIEARWEREWLPEQRGTTALR